MSIRYRHDIDGLRAIAVMSVLVYHLDKNLLPGGFTGVDIFFVISGYLITSIIVKEIQEGKFSLYMFYEKRMRRILPAYFFLIIFTTIIGALIYTPAAFEDYGKAMSHSMLFLSNFLFAAEVDYFSQGYNSSMLLHTWSLSVEEQYYLLWPLVLSVLAPVVLKGRFSVLFIGFLLISLALSEMLSVFYPKQAFYMIYSRAWELGVGALIALPILTDLKTSRARSLMGIVGCLLITISFFYLNDESRFPGLNGCIAVIGSGLLIYAGKMGKANMIQRILSIKPLVWIGLVSYSLYLWHWPLIEMSKYIINEEMTGIHKLPLALVSIIMAYISYKFVEQPFRRKQLHHRLKNIRTSKRIVMRFTVVSILFLGIGVVIKETEGLPGRFSETHQEYLYSTNPLRDECHMSREVEELSINERSCTKGVGDKRAILWGDSHADHYMEAMGNWTLINNLKLLQVSKSACLPLVGEFEVWRWSDGEYKKYAECSSVNNQVMEKILTEDIDTVILASRWENYFQNGKDKLNNQILLGVGESPEKKGKEKDIFKRNFESMIKRLTSAGIKVTVLGQVPFFSKNPPECYLKRETPLVKLIGQKITWGSEEQCRDILGERNSSLNQSREYFSQNFGGGVSYFDPLPYFCDEMGCSAKRNGKILYHDNHHLNTEGAKYLDKYITRDLGNLTKKIDKNTG